MLLKTDPSAAQALEQQLGALFDKLKETASGESARRIMEACRFLQQNGAVKITTSAVGNYCKDKFGGPAVQSIRNKPDTLLCLVKLNSDLHELSTGRPGSRARASKSELKIDNPAVAAYVAVLEAQVQELKKSNERLTHGFRKLQPLQIGSVLGGASNGDTADKTSGPFLTEVEHDAIAKFLNPRHLDRFGLGIDERQRMVDGSQVLAESPVVRLLARLLEAPRQKTGAG